MREITLAIFLSCLILLAVSLGGTYLLFQWRESTRQECTVGYMWSFKEEGCIPGYRP